MKKFFRNISIRYKLTFLVVLACTITLVVGFYIALKNDINFLKADFIELTHTEAKLIGEYALKPLSIRDKEGVDEVLKKSTSVPYFLSIELYDNQGKLFSKIGDIQTKSPKKITLMEDEALFIEEQEELIFSHIITHGGHTYGYLILRNSTQRLTEAINRDIAVLFLAAVVILLIGGFITFFAQKAVSLPITKLADYIHLVADQDNVSKTIDVYRQDEIGSIYRAINKLTHKIQQRSDERDELFKEISRNNVKLENTLEAFSNGYWEFDVENQTWLFGQVWLKTFGYSSDNISEENTHFLNLIHPDDFEIYQLQLTKHLEGKTDFFEAEFRLLSKKEGYTWVNFRGKWVERNGEQVTRILGITNNTQSLKEREEELKDQINHQLHDKKTLALSRMVSGISLSLKNLIHPILGHADFGLQTTNDLLLKGELRRIKQAAHDANSIVEDLLDFAGQKNSEPVEFDLKRALESCIAQLKTEELNEVHIVFETTLKQLTLQGNDQKIKHAIQHVLKNALQASKHPNDQITIQLDYLEIDPKNQKEYLHVKPSEYARVQVIDTGIGIPDQNKDLIFEPFFTTQPLGQGVGLGLSVARGILKAHNGFVLIKSEPSMGTIATLLIPLMQ